MRRIGDSVRRLVGPWTPSVHRLLRHLAEQEFIGAPRVLGIDGAGREVHCHGWIGPIVHSFKDAIWLSATPSRAIAAT